MSEPSRASNPANEPSDKKPYEKPAIAWEEPLEVRPALMSGCGKVLGGGGACDGAEGS